MNTYTLKKSNFNPLDFLLMKSPGNLPPQASPSLYLHKTNPNHQLVIINNSPLKYVSKNYGSNYQTTGCKWAIGFVNQRENQIELVEVKSIFELKKKKDQKEKKEEKRQEELNTNEMKKKLVNEFGSKKSRKKAKQKQNNILANL